MGFFVSISLCITYLTSVQGLARMYTDVGKRVEYITILNKIKQIMDTKIAGSIGGRATAKRGEKYYRNLQKLSVKARKENILRNFNVGDLENKVTVETLRAKFEQLDNEN